MRAIEPWVEEPLLGFLDGFCFGLFTLCFDLFCRFFLFVRAESLFCDFEKRIGCGRGLASDCLLRRLGHRLRPF